MPSRPPSSRRQFYAYRQKPRSGSDPAQSTSATLTAIGQGQRSTRSFTTLLRAFLSLLGSDRKTMAIVLAVASVATLLALVPLYGTKIVFDYVLADHPLPATWRSWVPAFEGRHLLLACVALGMIGFSVISLVLGMWSRWHTTRVTKRVQIYMRRKVFGHAVRLPLHRVYELKSGGVASMLREDVGSVGDLVFAMLYNPWRAIIQLIGSLIVLTLTDWRLLLGSLVLLPIVYYSHKTWIKRIRPLWRDIRSRRQYVDAGATEAFGGARVVRSFSRQRFEALQFIRNNHMMIRQELLAWWWSRGIDIAWSILIPTGSAVLLWYGGMRILADAARVKAGLISIEQALTVGDLVMFLTYLAAMLSPLAVLAASATGFQNGLAALDRVLDLLAEPKEMPSRPGAIEVDPAAIEGEIRFRHVSFTYPEVEAPALRDVSFDAKSGQLIALVGPSGAGKTTLCNLVARFFDPTEGVIEVDGIDLCDIKVDSYRRLLGIVEQDIFLFDGTVAQNIGYGRRGATGADIRRAAELANADGFITDLPCAYETVIGERGVKLSGGQRQRLAIARAIVADPKLLLLDEATSNLDTETERLIQASLQTLMAGRTSFVISHRLSTIAHADHIIVLERGMIVEQGRHHELISGSGRYREMVERQIQPPVPIASELTDPVVWPVSSGE